MSSPLEKADASALKQTARDRVREARGWERVVPVFIHRTSEGVQVVVHWRRLIVSFFALIVAAAFALTLAAWVYVHSYKGVKTVSYWHLALPWRWDEYRVLRGAHYVATAKEMLATSQWRGA